MARTSASPTIVKLAMLLPLMILLIAVTARWIMHHDYQQTALLSRLPPVRPERPAAFISLEPTAWGASLSAGCFRPSSSRCWWRRSGPSLARSRAVQSGWSRPGSVVGWMTSSWCWSVSGLHALRHSRAVGDCRHGHRQHASLYPACRISGMGALRENQPRNDVVGCQSSLRRSDKAARRWHLARLSEDVLPNILAAWSFRSPSVTRKPQSSKRR